VSELKHVYSLAAIFRKAWGIARHNAKHQGGSPKAHIAAALKQAWAAAKLNAQRTAESNARVQAAIEQIKASHTKEATAARAAQMAAFKAQFLPPRRSSGFRRAA
jgi:hypothetical protein